MEDNVRAVRKAAEDDEIFGAFFIAERDFEHANFEREELEEVVWLIAKGRGIAYIPLEKFREFIKGWQSIDELLKNSKDSISGLLDLSKGKREWGEGLMLYAFEHPYLNGKHFRPIIDAINLARRTSGASYYRERSMYRVDRDTGRLVERH